jgi:hypothetical protein
LNLISSSENSSSLLSDDIDFEEINENGNLVKFSDNHSDIFLREVKGFSDINQSMSQKNIPQKERNLSGK